MDFNIIMEILNQNRNFYNENINVSKEVGFDNYQNILGLLDSYKQKLGDVGIDIPLIDGITNLTRINHQTNQPYNTFELIEQLEQYALQNASGFVASTGGKQM